MTKVRVVLKDGKEYIQTYYYYDKACMEASLAWYGAPEFHSYEIKTVFVEEI